ncbi:MAG: hypothetical protein WD471_00780 [Candidatus Paceibacterota bacterium]
MTIIKPNKNKSTFLPLMLIFTIVLVGGLVYIQQYNELADNRHEIETLKEGIKQAEVANAELKNEFYKVTDPSNLESLALELNLRMEKSPSYLNINQWVSDSSY